MENNVQLNKNNKQGFMLNAHNWDLVGGLGRVNGDIACDQSDGWVVFRKQLISCPTEFDLYLHTERHSRALSR